MVCVGGGGCYLRGKCNGGGGGHLRGMCRGGGLPER